MKGIIALVLGVVLTVVGCWWLMVYPEHNWVALLPAVVAGLGGALIVGACGFFLDLYSPTSRKL